MEPIKENPNQEVGQSQPVEQNLVPEAVPMVESAPLPEVEVNPEQTMDGQEVVTENGQVFQAPPHDDANTDVAAHVEHIAPLPEEEKLWQLKLIARDQNLLKAIEVAKKLDDPWLEDKFHDDLMDDPELRAQLEALGKIEKL